MTRKQAYTSDESVDLLRITASARESFFRAWSIIRVDRPIEPPLLCGLNALGELSGRRCMASPVPRI